VVYSKSFFFFLTMTNLRVGYKGGACLKLGGEAQDFLKKEKGKN